MTAVASPPSLQPLKWSSTDGGDGLESMSEEVTRILMPRKGVQRTNSSSSTTTPSSSSSTAMSAPAPQTNGDTPTMNGDAGGGWGIRKKPARGLWPSSKAEPVSGLSTARSQALPAPSSGQSAASTMNSAMQQPAPMLPSQSKLPSQQPQNGSRVEQSSGSTDAPAILALLPMTGTFERKQIMVPYYPEMLKIGRQTNAKTVPTAVNGYFDSKVLSRQHAEVWAEKGKIWIRDVKSSNGTFVNGQRLSPENRESEAHELHEGDTLELGIDIVSEDQKSIVHHKVSAKVELAGIYPNPPTLLEMDFNHSNVNGGNAMLGEPMREQLSQMRGRGGSNGSMAGNRPSSMAGSNANLMGPQRQMNLWMNPITIEQVVKKLTTELKQAKHQSHELHKTGDFFKALLTLEPGEEPPKSPAKVVAEEKQANGIAPPAQLDPLSPFSQPPAPPPQQPLPEKPDVARFSPPDSLPSPSLKRVDTERSRSALSSPTRTEPPSGQIMSLVEALKSAKMEIDSQGDRVKYLEVALARERKAREQAERHAQSLSRGHFSPKDHETNGSVEEAAFEPPLDSMDLMEQELTNGHKQQDEDEQEDLLRRSASMATIKNPGGVHTDTEEIDASTSRLQARLDLMVKEMDDMKRVMESYKRRAEVAEEGRRSLAEMVENLRAGRGANNAAPSLADSHSTAPRDNTLSDDSDSVEVPLSKDSDRNLLPSHSYRSQPNGSAVLGNIHRELEKSVSSVLQQHQRQYGGPGESGRIVQSAPYVSMVGVVLIGVGIMTWLNGWQPGGEK
ncbi:hypothetical protein P7C71_g2995, partial [Lecanoromycetidae sp. Uapishka_2]